MVFHKNIELDRYITVGLRERLILALSYPQFRKRNYFSDLTFYNQNHHFISKYLINACNNSTIIQKLTSPRSNIFLTYPCNSELAIYLAKLKSANIVRRGATDPVITSPGPGVVPSS